MLEITASLVRQLVADIVRNGLIDEVDVLPHVRPFMAAVVRHGLPRATLPAPILESYAVARDAVDRVVAERARGHRPPCCQWPKEDAEMLDDPDLLSALFPEPVESSPR